MSSDALLLLVVAILLAAGALIVGPLWWVRRPTPVPRESETPLPLFSGASAASWPTGFIAMSRLAAEPSAASAPVIEGDVVRFAEPADPDLPVLNGVFEVLSGPDVGRTIRFVRRPNAPVDLYTFGRAEGAPFRHIQLRDGLVNRRQARLRHDDGHWSIENLSVDHPVTCNGSALPVGELHALEDGDQLMMGSTLFRFRA